VGMVLKGREAMEEELADIDSRCGCREVVMVGRWEVLDLLTATRAAPNGKIRLSGTLKSLTLETL